MKSPKAKRANKLPTSRTPKLQQPIKPRASLQKRGVFHFGADHLRGASGSDGARPKRPAAVRRRATPAPRAPTGEPLRLLAFNKPYGVICQFTRDGTHPALADFIDVPGVYPAGRLDTDSEGLLLLTNHGPLQHWISSPQASSASHRPAVRATALPKVLPKTYWVQVEGEPDAAAIQRLCAPLDLGDFITLPCQARRIEAPPALWPRNPPIRHRALIPVSWLEITLTEGKNRQIRRMTAKTGFPTLRLIRAAIGAVALDDLALGQWRDVSLSEIGYS